MSIRQLLLFAVLAVGCRPAKAPDVAAKPETVLAAARDRTVDANMQSRFNIKVKSKALDIGGSTGGGVVLGRPGRGRLDVFPPLGSNPLLSLATDGTAIAVLISRQRRHLVAESAEQVIRQTTDGAAGVDDVLAVLQGDLPFDDASAKKLEVLEDGGVLLTLLGPNKTKVLAELDAENATPRRIEALDKKGRQLLEVTYGDFTEIDGQLLPEQVSVFVPSLELSLTLKYKAWKRLEQAPEVFTIDAPEGVESEALEEAMKGLLDAGVEGAAEALGPAPE